MLRMAVWGMTFGAILGLVSAFEFLGGMIGGTATPARAADFLADADDESDDDELDDDNPYRPGLIERVRTADGGEHVRVAETVFVAEAAEATAADERRAGNPPDVTFTGCVLVQSPGEHRLHAFASGHVRVALAGQTLLDGKTDEPAWHASDSIELPFGFHALEVHYRGGDRPARLNLFWEGPNFALEPLAARWLFHEREQTPPDDFERGGQLVRALRCAACHRLPAAREPLRAAALDRLQGNLSREWLVARLSDEAGAGHQPQSDVRNMPHFGMSRADAEAIADFLFERSEPHATAAAAPQSSKKEQARPKKSAKDKRDKEAPEPEPPSAAAGATLFRSVGCLACHRVDGLGTAGRFGGGDLTRVAEKRPAGFFARWLADPAAINRDHRMPVFALSDDETASLALYLESLGDKTEARTTPNGADTERGAALVRQHQCGACHALPSEQPASRKRLAMDLTELERGGGCLAQPDAKRSRPGYRLDASSREAVATYLRTRRASPVVMNSNAETLLAENRCLACHARGHNGGLRPSLAAVVEADPALQTALPRMIPPALVGIGDKLHDEALAAAVTRSAAARYTWLDVRMPKFPLTKKDTATLVRHFIAADRIPPRPGDEGKSHETAAGSQSEVEGAGARLVTADGFGCTSCHAIGKWTPQKVAAGAEGVALSNIGDWVRKSWFERWVRNPVRIVPEMEMPSIVQPIRGVLDDKLDRQIAAIWTVLDRDDFTPPAPNALRVVRRSNLPNDLWQAAVLTDVIEVGNVPFVKPLVFGFHNRHNVLYDLASGRLAAWWTGDTARQRTRGKTWFWEAGVPQLLPVDAAPRDDGSDCELVLIVDGKRVNAVPRGQYVTEFDTIVHATGGVTLTHRMHYPINDDMVTLHVSQRFIPLEGDPSEGRSGFRRQVAVEGLPEGAACELLVLPGNVSIDEQSQRVRVGNLSAQVSSVVAGATLLAKTEQGGVIRLTSNGKDAASAVLDYRADVQVDQFAPLPAVDRRVPQATLDVVPGFEAVRLPVSDRPMPTGLAWRPDGTLIVASLEGRVWLGRDTDGDQLEDELLPLSDDLAAPYGVAAAGDAIDVINKYGLLRLFDEDGDGRAERTEQIASGWGHTRDYHDWVIGLPRDPEGNYYVSVPCQQDKRSPAAAHLRGHVLRLTPRDPTPDDPRRFAIDDICGGLRFGNGIARSDEGELFVTDNQGNYNPFNELNHIVRGARYGFINKLEVQQGLKPPVTPAAIEIPHPWTRSVNGICFLTAPDTAGRSAEELFGPLAGHLVGCEYDTRRLVRMSLQRVGDTYQGAAYPMSSEPAAGAETFEGPVACQVAPDGYLYSGNIRDSGWGGGSNTGSIVRLRRQGPLPAGIAEVRARADGFVISFTQPVDRALAADADNYAISSYRRVSTPAYGGPDVDRRVEQIARADVAADRHSVNLVLPELREGFVYELHLRKLVNEGRFFPAEAYYTLRKRPGV